MKPITMIIVAALTFGLCFLFDKGYTKLFRSKAQHQTGLQVRPSKRYGSFGLILCVLGIVAIFTGLSVGGVLLFGGVVVFLMGIILTGYYMSYGIYYDDDSFLLTAFPKGSRTYHYADICTQKLYRIQGGSIVVELHMEDGSAVSVQTAMEGAYAFLDHAFYRWCSQTGKNPISCDFHDPANSLWFPSEEDV